MVREVSWFGRSGWSGLLVQAAPADHDTKRGVNALFDALLGHEARVRDFLGILPRCRAELRTLVEPSGE